MPKTSALSGRGLRSTERTRLSVAEVVRPNRQANITIHLNHQTDIPTNRREVVQDNPDEIILLRKIIRLKKVIRTRKITAIVIHMKKKTALIVATQINSQVRMFSTAPT